MTQSNQGESNHEVPEEVADESATSEGPPEESLEEQPFDTPRGSSGGSDPLAAAQDELAERTADLQRLQAEYLNYKKRVDRDRDTVRKSGEAGVLQALLTTLDDIRRADEHGELTGGFKSVADSVQSVASKFGLEAFGAKGDAFDPQLHEAVFHAGVSADVDVTSIENVMLVGYRVGDRVLRAATVGVVDPADDAPAESADEPTE